jgi:hypothetical protein
VLAVVAWNMAEKHAAAGVAAVLERIGEHPRAYILDFSAVPTIDSIAAATIAGFAHKVHRRGAAICLAGARPDVRRLLVATAWVPLEPASRQAWQVPLNPHAGAGLAGLSQHRPCRWFEGAGSPLRMR